MTLSKQQILTAKSDTTIVSVDTPEWGDDASVCVRSLSGNERDTYEQAIYEQGSGSFRGLRAKLVAPVSRWASRRQRSSSLGTKTEL